MANKTIKISEKNYNKIMNIKEMQGLKSADNVIDTILPFKYFELHTINK